MRMSPFHMMPGDKGSLDGVKLANGTFKRVWVFARPYRRTISIFLAAIFVAALLALVPPFVVREIIDRQSMDEFSQTRILPKVSTATRFSSPSNSEKF